MRASFVVVDEEEGVWERVWERSQMINAYMHPIFGLYIFKNSKRDCGRLAERLSVRFRIRSERFRVRFSAGATFLFI